jgi:hypothetical protein
MRIKQMDVLKPDNRDSKLFRAVIAGTVSLLILSIIFITTMIKLSDSIDWHYLSWALLRITLISMVVALFSTLLSKMGPTSSALFGASLGLVIGVLYVLVTINA